MRHGSTKGTKGHEGKQKGSAKDAKGREGKREEGRRRDEMR
ncbi:MAG: hypothetical protein ETSY1_38210 [Candidatus Entotheonella factor]|uniref:Uncharacterized protein n=1 Tax=Entotheonella factor TaxID=1429438 RepID=W4L6I8_ENTF1|nr:MAG: hypothetical protein ETSY1_38210 [Candidatus Entotheonella factor]